MASSINTGVPSSFPIPGTWINISSAGSTNITTDFVVVLMGTMTSGSSATINTLAIAGAVADVQTAYGATSDIATMYTRYREIDPVTTVYLISPATSAGTDVATALTSLNNFAFDVAISPYSTEDVVNAFDTYCSTTWGYASELYGIHITAASDTFTNLAALGATANSKYTEIAAFAPGSTDSVAQRAAAVGAVTVIRASADPALPLQEMSLNVAPSGFSNAFNISQRTSLFNAGLAITREDFSGNVYLERSRTTYQTNSAGLPDTSYQNVETLLSLSYSSKYIRTGLTSVFFGNNPFKIVDDGNPIPNSGNITTPSAIQAEIVSLYSDLVTDYICQDQATFNTNVSVQYAGNGVVNAYIPLILANQLRQINASISFTAA
ncbi:Mu-like protein prophage tail sheath protein gpL-like protein [Gluconacetobacter diazotrophicus PA1 5]|uniref:Mu-like protein prophage tail sheath protein gpL-like protein n=1 Tax=Gluconacetobacter diazotrophicus TaxID=33996 RepID=UPI000173B3C2|nr:Mu-like protein prophage tail sheath protein gpL-like protein [Gluconacetobacter diazotrophicus]ACI50352.1 Mu-like protein prophage tail sheath protein gpL-like protein [Gluconacetobacter diazotrophicus PA1 5]